MHGGSLVKEFLPSEEVNYTTSATMLGRWSYAIFQGDRFTFAYVVLRVGTRARRCLVLSELEEPS